MKKIDYDLIDSYEQLGTYQAKAALAAYAQDEFNIKIQQNLSFANMKAKLIKSVKPVDSDSFTMTDVTDELDTLVSTPQVDTVKEVVVPVAQLEQKEIVSMAKEVVKSNTTKEELMKLLPPDFSPCFNPMGEYESFYPLSYWINDWIQDNPDWKEKINEYPRVQEHKFLYTLVYYIAIYGKFKIRETRNSEYITLS